MPTLVGYFSWDNRYSLCYEVFPFVDRPNLSITFPLQKYFFSGSYLIGVEVWPRKIEERGFGLNCGG